MLLIFVMFFGSHSMKGWNNRLVTRKYSRHNHNTHSVLCVSCLSGLYLLANDQHDVTQIQYINLSKFLIKIIGSVQPMQLIADRKNKEYTYENYFRCGFFIRLSVSIVILC